MKSWGRIVTYTQSTTTLLGQGAGVAGAGYLWATAHVPEPSSVGHWVALLAAIAGFTTALFTGLVALMGRVNDLIKTWRACEECGDLKVENARLHRTLEALTSGEGKTYPSPPLAVDRGAPADSELDAGPAERAKASGAEPGGHRPQP